MTGQTARGAPSVIAMVSAMGLLAACGAERSPPLTAERPLAVRTEPARDSTRLVLLAAAGWKINARLKPVLEEADGALLGFDAHRLTPDSAYFAEPPTATMPGRHRAVGGTLRASVCAAGEQVCRSVVLRVR